MSDSERQDGTEMVKGLIRDALGSIIMDSSDPNSLMEHDEHSLDKYLELMECIIISKIHTTLYIPIHDCCCHR